METNRESSIVVRPSYDCLVLGGGPAGCTAATLLAQSGCRTLLVEREQMPRCHVGESLMPESYWTLARLGVLPRMQASHFPKKYGVQFIDHLGCESHAFHFFEHDPRDCSQTWQVLRGEFDQMLFENAAEQGAQCRDQTRALEVLFDGERAIGARIQGPGQPPQDVRAGVVIDATGQQSPICTRLGPREVDHGPRHAAIWTYYRGARRDPGIAAGASLLLHTRDRLAWFWYLPLPDDLVSVGVVSQADYLLRGRGKPESVFEEELVNCPAVVERLIHAQLAGEFCVTRDDAHLASRSAGDGWVFMGDSFGFLDPVFSCDVYLALKSGEMAADAVIEGLARGDTSAAQLGKWTGEFARGLERIRKLVYAFYTQGFNFGRFVEQFPRRKGDLTDLLMGRVFGPAADKIFDDLDPWLAQCANRQTAQRAETA